jgi:uncharacterized membrane protein YhaH (DUF805 family)
MTFVGAVRMCLRKYATFSGRASRPEYWWFIAFVWLVSTGLSIVDAAIWGPTLTEVTEISRDADGAFQTTTNMQSEYGNGPLASLWGLGSFLPALAAGWRRLHDTGRPGWYNLLPFIPPLIAASFLMSAAGLFSGELKSPEELLVGLEQSGGALIAVCAILAVALGITLLVFLCQRSQPGSNVYGPDPSEVTS